MHSMLIGCIFLFFTNSVLLFLKKNRIIPNMYVNDMDNERNIHKGILCVTEES